MVWLIVATLAASFIKGVCGFANTLVFTTILSFSFNNVQITPMDLIIGYPANVIIAWKERRQINWRISLPVAALIIFGNIPGIFMLKNVDTRTIKVIFGFFIIAMGIEMLMRERAGKKQKQSKIILGLIGVLSGLCCGLYGVGALLAAYMDRVTEDSHAFKGNLCFVFWIECTFRLIVYPCIGILNWQIFRQAVCMIPFMVLALVFGMKCCGHLNETVIKRLVIIVLILSGIALVIHNLC